MKIAVFINCHSLLISKRYDCLRLFIEIHTDSAILSLDVDE